MATKSRFKVALNICTSPNLFFRICLIIFVPFFILSLPTTHAETSQLDNPDSSFENQAINLDNQLMCPICPGETLRQSQTTIAKQMRGIIRNKLANGESPDQIKNYFVSVYGQSILAEPPSEGAGLLAWALPPFAIFTGLFILILTLRAMKKKTPDSIVQSGSLEINTQKQLDPFIAMVDEELKSGRD